MTEQCGKCKSTNISGGSWVPDRCMNCGAIETIGDVWYYDATAQPTIASIRKKSGYKPKPKQKAPAKKILVEKTREFGVGKPRKPFDKSMSFLKGFMYLVMALISMCVIGVFAGLGDSVLGGVGAFIGICVGCCVVVFIWRRHNV